LNKKAHYSQWFDKEIYEFSKMKTDAEIFTQKNKTNNHGFPSKLSNPGYPRRRANAVKLSEFLLTAFPDQFVIPDLKRYPELLVVEPEKLEKTGL
jgi:hypothetical protein